MQKGHFLCPLFSLFTYLGTISPIFCLFLYSFVCEWVKKYIFVRQFR